jgi:hypothetical protein
MHKIYLRSIQWLNNQGRYWFVYRGAWNKDKHELPARWVLLFGSKEQAQVAISRQWHVSFNETDNICMVPLELTDAPKQLITCFRCGGSCKQTVEYSEELTPRS